MAWMELPHSSHCLVCGRDNAYGLKLSLHVDSDTGIVRCAYTPTQHHVGFDGIVHGGVLATVIDEAMVWAATWRGKRFCVCGELTVRYRVPVKVGQKLIVTAELERSRPRLIETVAKMVLENAGNPLATANGKYVPLDAYQHDHMITTMLEEGETTDALTYLRNTPVSPT